MTELENRPCSLCGYVYDRAIAILLGAVQEVFDGFECALQLLAPTCAHCGRRMIGQGLGLGGVMCCCVHGAEKKGEERLRDRV